MSIIDARIVKNLPAVKDTPAFHLNLHFRADDGICLILGASGSGKTLLLNCIGGFLRPSKGRIMVHDQIYFDAAAHVHLPPDNRRCGYIFQDHALFPHMTVRQNLRFAASLPGSNSRGRVLHRRIQELLQSFDLTELAERKPAQLSGGEKQRAALARTLATEPRLLLLDEPSRGLDARLRQGFYKLLRDLSERLRIPILMVSHDVDECFEVADSVCVMEGGRQLQAGTRDAVFGKPATAEIARLLGIYNIAPAVIRSLDPGANSSRLEVFGQEIDGPYFPGHLIGDAGFLCIRRSETRLSNNGAGKSDRQLLLRIEGRNQAQEGTRVLLENGFSVIVRPSEDIDLNDARRLTVMAPPSAMAFTPK